MPIDPTSPRPITILRLITRMNIGGPSIHVSVLSRGVTQLDRHPVENHIAYGALEAGEGDMSDLLTGSDAHIHIIPELQQQVRPLKDLIALVKIFFLMLRIRPDIVHTHTAKAGILGRMAALLTFRRVIVHTYHGHSFSGYFSKAFEIFFRLTDRVLNFFSTAIISISAKLTDELCDVHHVVNRRKVVEIPLGLPLTPFFECAETKAQARLARSLPTDKIIIGCVGRFVPIKNHVTLIQAWAQQSPAFHAAHQLILIGDGPEIAHMQTAIAQNNLSASITIVPFSRDLPGYYRACDLFILPSLNEGTPVTMLEAMATGVPVLASWVGGIPDLLGDITQEIGAIKICARGVGFAPTLPGIAETLHALGAGLLPTATKATAQEFAHGYAGERLVKDVAQLYERLIA